MLDNKKKEEWYVYLLRCADHSLYTGIAKDYEKRFIEHSKGIGAKYTRSRKPIKLEKIYLCYGRSEASKLESKIKKLTKEKKEKIIENKFSIENTTEVAIKIKS